MGREWATHALTSRVVCVQAVKRTLSQLHTEIVALKSLSHPNILQLLHVELDAVYPKKSGEQVGWAAKERGWQKEGQSRISCCRATR